MLVLAQRLSRAIWRRWVSAWRADARPADGSASERCRTIRCMAKRP